MGRRTQLALAGGFTVAVAHACIGWGVDIDEGCAVNADCETGYVCIDGACRKVCSTSGDCEGSQACLDGVCMRLQGALCNTADDCTEPGVCEVPDGATCFEGECVFAAASVGASCDDGDPCTLADACDAARVCIGTPRVCDQSPNDECSPDDQTFISYPAIGTCHRPDGDCEYPATQTSCPNCGLSCLLECEGVVCDDPQGGCSFNGTCIGGVPAECSYTHATDGSACDLDGDPVGSGNGFCDGGQCLGCLGPENCLSLPAGEAQCYDIACTGGACEYTLRDGLGCNDGDDCTYDDTCDGSAVCGGASITCTSGSGTCGVQSSCNGTNTCTEIWPDSGTTCDDGDLCTYNDRCNGSGGCAGTGITCTGSGGACDLQSTCNGTSTCVEAWPGSSTSCNDGNDCTHTDRCNGSGGCAGTGITCSNDAPPCGATRSCNGTSSCSVSYPGSGTSCNDGNNCTHTDRCNGGGGCAGTGITCTDDAGTCAANRSCNGTSSCSVSYPGSGTGCNDGNACTSGDHCNSGGGCVGGGSSADGTQCGGSWERCCSGVCRNLAGNNSYCGSCSVNCASAGMTCGNTGTGGYACHVCVSTVTCRGIYNNNTNVSCWATTSSPPGVGYCQCQCGPSGGPQEVCADGGCGANMNCYDCAGDNFCTPGGTPGPCP